MLADGPIAVFDSGIGGLSVVAELWHLLPGEEIVYFGDTARVPYGTKSPETVTRYVREILAFLLRQNPKIVVAACNTASALAVEQVRPGCPVPLVDVVRPGALAAVEYSRQGSVGVIATEATVASGAYPKAIHEVDPNMEVHQVAGPLLVPMVEEERRHDHPLVRGVIEEYLAPVRNRLADVLVLGCTHYPVFKPAFQEVAGEDVYLVDSAEQTALTVSTILRDEGTVKAVRRLPSHRFYVSDNPERFRRIGSLFLHKHDLNVILVKPDEFFSPGDSH